MRTLGLEALCVTQVFNFALWRAFGTDSFAKSIGFLTNTGWGKVQQDAACASDESIFPALVRGSSSVGS